MQKFQNPWNHLDIFSTLFTQVRIFKSCHHEKSKTKVLIFVRRITGLDCTARRQWRGTKYSTAGG